MAFGRAAFSSTCGACDSRIHAGDEIHTDDDGTVHAGCVDDNGARELEAQSVCPVCFLTICDCAREGLTT